MLERLTKKEMLDVLEFVPQSCWPPRPTRQDKVTLRRAIQCGLKTDEREQIQWAIHRSINKRSEVK